MQVRHLDRQTDPYTAWAVAAGPPCDARVSLSQHSQCMLNRRHDRHQPILSVTLIFSGAAGCWACLFVSQLGGAGTRAPHTRARGRCARGGCHSGGAVGVRLQAPSHHPRSLMYSTHVLSPTHHGVLGSCLPVFTWVRAAWGGAGAGRRRAGVERAGCARVGEGPARVGEGPALSGRGARGLGRGRRG